MLWRAGQERKVREHRETLAQFFIAARDAAINVGISMGQIKSESRYQLPSYIEVEAPVRTTESRDAMLAKLGALFPGMVTRGDA